MTEWLHFQFSLSWIGEGNFNPLQCSCLENLRDGGAWWASVYGVAQNQKRLKRLSKAAAAVPSELREWTSYRWRVDHHWSEGRTNCKAIVNNQAEEFSFHRCKNHSSKVIEPVFHVRPSESNTVVTVFWLEKGLILSSRMPKAAWEIGKE